MEQGATWQQGIKAIREETSLGPIGQQAMVACANQLQPVQRGDKHIAREHIPYNPLGQDGGAEKPLQAQAQKTEEDRHSQGIVDSEPHKHT